MLIRPILEAEKLSQRQQVLALQQALLEQGWDEAALSSKELGSHRVYDLACEAKDNLKLQIRGTAIGNDHVSWSARHVDFEIEDELEAYYVLKMAHQLLIEHEAKVAIMELADIKDRDLGFPKNGPGTAVSLELDTDRFTLREPMIYVIIEFSDAAKPELDAAKPELDHVSYIVSNARSLNTHIAGTRYVRCPTLKDLLNELEDWLTTDDDDDY